MRPGADADVASVIAPGETVVVERGHPGVAAAVDGRTEVAAPGADADTRSRHRSYEKDSRALYVLDPAICFSWERGYWQRD